LFLLGYFKNTLAYFCSFYKKYWNFFPLPLLLMVKTTQKGYLHPPESYSEVKPKQDEFGEMG